jgi:ELWxxDGT repeat protein
LTVAGGLFYFTSEDAAGDGADLYASNGTARGTTLLHDFAQVPAAAKAR